ncbi:MAG: carbon starvation protein A [Rickettsiales bacterium]|jgi:carbon starvation protein|nr:carbon starvation protein A [Rickettsiales bacterium]
MSSLALLLISVGVCLCGYLFYGRWLAKKWGIDVNAKTPATTMNDGVDYAPHPKFDVFSHQFSTIAGAGPITGPIIAATFGWMPVVLWILVGGIFFGAVQDFLSLYASVKEDGKSIGMLIEKYIGKTGKQTFLLFSWLLCMLVMAAFIDIVAGTFNGVDANGVSNFINSSTASISVFFTFIAVAFGYFTHKVKLNQIVKAVLGILLLVIMCVVGISFPITLSKNMWIFLIALYMFVVSILPMWALKMPRDYFCFFLLFGVMIVSVLGIILINPSIGLNSFNGFYSSDGKFFFPFLFITVACGSVSGFHALVSAGTTSKAVSKESDMLFVGYGAMLLECVLAVVSVIAVAILSTGNLLPKGTPFQVFSTSVGSFFSHFGFSQDIANCIVAMSISTFALSSLDAVGRIGRMSFCEFFTTQNENKSVTEKVLTNNYFSLFLTLLGGFALCLGGYRKIWVLFGAANQLCVALVLMSLLVFLKSTKRNEKMLYIPVAFMFIVTLVALITTIISIFNKIFIGGNFVFLVDGLQLVVAIALVVLALEVLYCSVKKLRNKTA